MSPTVGRIVHYQLSAQDVTQIETRRRVSGGPLPASMKATTKANDDPGGKVVADDYVFPMMITRVKADGSVNGQVFLDSVDQHWVRNRTEGETAGQWSWPTRAANEGAPNQ